MAYVLNGLFSLSLTLHHILLDHLTQLLHVGLGEVFAVLGGLEPLIRAGIALEFGGSRLRDLTVGHGEADLREEKVEVQE
jgi:hypothetical protein